MHRQIAVRTELVVEQLVDRLLEWIERQDVEAPAQLSPLARRGYLARVAETELFPAARGRTPGLDGRDVHATASALAAGEPLEKPAPDDPKAFTWRVPGPGGHVRHLVALACVAAEGGANRALKRDWVYGFAVRCCEEGRSEGGLD